MMNFCGWVVCGAIAAVWTGAGAAASDERSHGAGHGAWSDPRVGTGLAGTKDPAAGPRRPLASLAREAVPPLGRWLSRAPGGGAATGSQAALPATSGATATTNAPPTADLSQRLIQRRLERIERVREQLLERGSKTARPSEHAGSREQRPAPQSPAPVAQGYAETLPGPPQIEYPPLRELPLQSPTNTLPSRPTLTHEPSHEVTIELPDEAELSKPKSSRLRSSRPGSY
jgi:hypothetical protein